MSGPKLSQAEIERRQRARLENQREEYLRGAAGLQQQKDQICQWLAAKRSKSCAGESTAVADAVRRELEEGMSRLEEIPVRICRLLTRIRVRWPKRNRRTERDFPVWSGLSREKSSAWPRQTKAVRQEVGGETQQAYPILQRLDRPTASA